MIKNIKFMLLFIVIVGLLGSACSSNEAAIDQAVQQTVEAQQIDQAGNDESASNADSTVENTSSEPTEPVSMPIDSDTNEQASPTPEETAVITPSTADSESQRVLFTASEEGIYNLFSIKPNGENLQRITNFDTEYLISISPDLSHIAFTFNNLVWGYSIADSIGTSVIYVVPTADINNPSPKPVGGSEGIFDLDYLVWSPNNSQIAMFGTRLDNTGLYDSGIYIIDIEADEINFLVEDDAVEYMTWSPNGELLAFVSEENNLFTMNEDGSDLTELLNDLNSRYIHKLVWSSDSTKITFDQRIDDTTYTKTIDVNSSLITDQTNNEVADNQGVWSPDRTKLAFISTDDQNNDYDSNREVYVINADGSGLSQFTEYDESNTAWDSCPIWSPDGTQLTFISRYLTDENIAELIVSDGNNRIVLMRDSEKIRVDCPLVWKP